MVVYSPPVIEITNTGGTDMKCGYCFEPIDNVGYSEKGWAMTDGEQTWHGACVRRKHQFEIDRATYKADLWLEGWETT
jgi:hypothetical protein